MLRRAKQVGIPMRKSFRRLQKEKSKKLKTQNQRPREEARASKGRNMQPTDTTTGEGISIIPALGCVEEPTVLVYSSPPGTCWFAFVVEQAGPPTQ
jgi:hypothetical protein